MKFWGCICLALILMLWGAKSASAGQLANRLEQFPAWDSKPSVEAADGGDLVYPDWMAGTWEVTSTLEEMVAPLAPELVTPGFEGNRPYLHQPVKFQVRFVEKNVRVGLPGLLLQTASLAVVAEREFNGLQIARAYLGDRAVLSVKVDSNNTNRQITQLQGDGQLISTVTGRASETPAPHQFIATEITQQVFRGDSQIYLNEVETTTAYQQLESTEIEADQVTAIYLSPQDPDYFAARKHPVALYRYRLVLSRLE